MFCPKCAVENPNDGKFCRKCGTDLSLISDIVSGNLTVDDFNKNEKGPTWESALILLSISVASFIISIILAFQPMGQGWWFWLLFAGFSMLGLGIAQVIGINRNKKNNIKISSDKDTSLPESENANALPPKQNEFVSDIPNFENKERDLVPPSVVEGTTRNLEINSESKTINLPKKDR